MANLKETTAWESGIYQLETTDPVVGGADGISNKQAIQLANRTSYLKGEIESLKSNSNAQLVLKRDISDSYSKTQTAALIAPKLDSTIAEATYLKKTDAYTKRESDDKFALKTELTDGLPIGAYLSYPSQKTIPAGFFIADGRSLKKTEYTELFDVIGYTYGGSGDNFNLPNFADGKFMRGIGGNAAALGIAQQDAIRNIKGSTGYGYGSAIREAGGATGAFTGGPDDTVRHQWHFSLHAPNNYQDVVSFDASKVVPTANENRPLNMAVVVIIKAKNVNTPTAGQIDKTILATETKAGITKLKNAITAKQEDAAVTEKAVSDLMEANKSIGIDQTWQDVLSQRKYNVVYTNTTNKPIFVSIVSYPTPSPTPYVSFYVDGLLVARSETSGTEDNTQITAVIPSGSTYKIDNGGDNGTRLKAWAELR